MSSSVWAVVEAWAAQLSTGDARLHEPGDGLAGKQLLRKLYLCLYTVFTALG